MIDDPRQMPAVGPFQQARSTTIDGGGKEIQRITLALQALDLPSP